MTRYCIALIFLSVAVYGQTLNLGWYHPTAGSNETFFVYFSTNRLTWTLLTAVNGTNRTATIADPGIPGRIAVTASNAISGETIMCRPITIPAGMAKPTGPVITAHFGG